VEWTDFAEEVNLLNTLTRRPEAYHDAIRSAAANPGGVAWGGIPGIHDLQRETPADLVDALVYDRWERAAFLDHFFVEPHPVASWAAGRLDERGDFTDGVWGWQTTSCGVALDRSGQVHTDSEGDHPVRLRKEYAFTDNQRLAVFYRIVNDGRGPLVVRFGVELNLFLPGLAFGRSQLIIGDQILSLDSPTPVTRVEGFTLSAVDEHNCVIVGLGHPATLYGHLVATVSQSEQGYERTVQAVAVMPSWELCLDPGQEWGGKVSVQIV
jgi:hypothetical protein